MYINSTSGINAKIKVNAQKLETVMSFKYLGSVITDESSKPEILFRIAQPTAALTRRFTHMVPGLNIIRRSTVCKK